MTRYFKIVGNQRYGHIFKIGAIVRHVKTLDDGVFVLEEIISSTIEAHRYREHEPIVQHVHPCDVKEVF